MAGAADVGARPAVVTEAPLLRPMTGADVVAAAALQATAMPNPWSAAQFIDALRPGHVAGVVESGGVALAAVGVVAVVADECELLTLAVDVRCQRRGYARLLLDNLLGMAIGRGARVCFLEVMDGNEPALSLYRSFGFSAVGLRRRYYQLPDGARDAIVMRAPLTTDKQWPRPEWQK